MFDVFYKLLKLTLDDIIVTRAIHYLVGHCVVVILFMLKCSIIYIAYITIQLLFFVHYNFTSLL